MPPVYNKFMDAAYTVADKVELITPARFLFDAGYTPKEWNQKMLNDEHFKVLTYEPDASKVFSGPEIKGGVVVSYRDSSSYFGAIGVFTKYPELNAILRKVREQSGESMESIIAPTLSFKLSKLMLEDYPNSIGRLRTSAFTTLSEIFFEKRPKDNKDYVSMIGVLGNKRTYRYVRRDYLVDGSNTLDKWTYLMPNASGSGEFGEKLTTGVVAGPGIAFSQTFNAFGCFNEEQPTLNIEKYIKSKFARSMLGVLKITQHLSAPKWKYVPLQDFTGASDIDWSRSIPEIDQQLYKKYSLSDEEIEFIETHVKEMA
jgi:type II restriction enzyme